MLTLPDMPDLFMHEFPRLRRRRFALSRIFSSSLTDFFFRHKFFRDESNCASMFVRNMCLADENSRPMVRTWTLSLKS